ncbi:LiaI-LiaF-like domain-containing protein [Simplicispira piscis]
MRGNIAAIVLILAGGFMLLTNLGVIDISLRELLRTWWPLILIAVGVGLFLTPDRLKK